MNGNTVSVKSMSQIYLSEADFKIGKNLRMLENVYYTTRSQVLQLNMGGENFCDLELLMIFMIILIFMMLRYSIVKKNTKHSNVNVNRYH